MFMSSSSSFGNIRSIMTHVHADLYWKGTSCALGKPSITIPLGAATLTETDKKILKQSLVALLVTAESDWTCLLLPMFKNPGKLDVASITLQFKSMTMIEVVTYFNDACDVAIRKAVEVYPEINLKDLQGFAFFISPMDNFNHDVMDENYMDYINDSEGDYSWDARIKLTPKDFIDSIANVKI